MPMENKPTPQAPTKAGVKKADEHDIVGKLMQKVECLEQKLANLDKNTVVEEKLPPVGILPPADLMNSQQILPFHPLLPFGNLAPNNNHGQGSEALQTMKIMMMSQILNFMQR